MPTKDMLTASSVNNLFSRVPSLSATGAFRPGRMSSAGGSIRPSDSAALRGPGSLNPSRPRGTGRGSGPGRDRSDANQWANAIGWDVLTRADTAAGRGVSTGEPKWRLAGTFQPEPTPPLAVRYLMGWASQPYGLAQQ